MVARATRRRPGTEAATGTPHPLRRRRSPPPIYRLLRRSPRRTRSSSRRRRSGSSSPRRTSPRAPSSRSYHGCPTAPSAASSACQNPGLPSAPTPKSTRWPQTLSGFFYHDSYDLHKQFHDLSGRGSPMVDPDLPFLGESYSDAIIVQCCSSLLLFQRYTMTSEEDRCDYLVCNPATEHWEVLPPIVLSDQEDAPSFSLEKCSTVFLGFDMAAPSRFVVFAAMSWHFNKSKAVAIYSSETRRWTCVQSEWDDVTMLVGNPECVFLNGTMHFTTCGYGRCSSLVTVDAEGKVWRDIEIPGITTDCDVFTPSIGHSQGRLYAWRLAVRSLRLPTLCLGS